MNAKEFLAALEALRRATPVDDKSLSNLRCQEVEACRSCTFCTRCTTCYRCTHCVDCSDATRCVHCRGCHQIHDVSYAVSSHRCVASSYLTLCEDCAECTFCWGCVGLRGKEFHILNEPYDRKTWFAMVAALAEETGVQPAHLR